MIIDFQAQKLRALVNRLQTIGEIYFLKKKVGNRSVTLSHIRGNILVKR
jgi:hypothetical protein